MKRQYQPSKIRRKRQHGFLARKSTKSGRATLRNRRRVSRVELLSQDVVEWPEPKKEKKKKKEKKSGKARKRRSQKL